MKILEFADNVFTLLVSSVFFLVLAVITVVEIPVSLIAVLFLMPFDYFSVLWVYSCLRKFMKPRTPKRRIKIKKKKHRDEFPFPEDEESDIFEDWYGLLEDAEY